MEGNELSLDQPGAPWSGGVVSFLRCGTTCGGVGTRVNGDSVKKEERANRCWVAVGRCCGSPVAQGSVSLSVTYQKAETKTKRLACFCLNTWGVQEQKMGLLLFQKVFQRKVCISRVLENGYVLARRKMENCLGRWK